MLAPLQVLQPPRCYDAEDEEWEFTPSVDAMTATHDSLRTALRRFMAGESSRELAAEIEVALDDLFPEDRGEPSTDAACVAPTWSSWPNARFAS